jgi:hypothetical protein
VIVEELVDGNDVEDGDEAGGSAVALVTLPVPKRIRVLDNAIVGQVLLSLVHKWPRGIRDVRSQRLICHRINVLPIDLSAK